MAKGIRLGRLSVATLALTLATACEKGADPDAPRHYTDVEIAQLEATVLKRVAANSARRCERPVLRGEPKPGTSTQDMLVLLEPTGTMKSCAEKVHAARTARTDDVDYRTPEMLALDDECGALVQAAVLDAISHTDACSPYQSGVRMMPGSVGSLGALGEIWNVAALLATRALRNHDLWLAASGLRWHHDLARGHPNLIIALLAYGGRPLMEVAWELVATASPEVGSDVAPAFDTLIATLPSFGPVLLGDHEFAALHMPLASLKPAGWIAPGGQSEEWKRQEMPRADAAHMLDTLDRMYAFDERHCGERTTLAQCWINLNAHQHEMMDAGGGWTEYVEKVAQGVARLIATRIALEVRRQGRCPTPDELRSPPYLALREAPVLGDRVQAALDGKTLTILPPVWAIDGGFKTPWVISCP